MQPTQGSSPHLWRPAHPPSGRHRRTADITCSLHQ